MNNIPCPIFKGKVSVAGFTRIEIEHMHNHRKCPICGDSARKTFGVPSIIKQTGWTTQEAVDAYFRRLVKPEADSRVEIQLKKRIEENPDMSKRQLKMLEKKLTDSAISALLLTKYHIDKDEADY